MNTSQEFLKVIIPVVIVILILWLIFRIKRQIKNMVKDEIYGDFPMFKEALENYKLKIDYLNDRIETIEHRLRALEQKQK